MTVVKDEPCFIPIPQQYIAGMGFEYGWAEQEVKEFIEHYIELKRTEADPVETILTLAHRFKRKDAEVVILILDLGERGYISGIGKGSNPRPFKLPKQGKGESARSLEMRIRGEQKRFKVPNKIIG